MNMFERMPMPISDAKASESRLASLERSSKFIVATLSSTNYFDAVDPSVTAYTSGLRRTIYFTDAADNPYLSINGLGYRPVEPYLGKQLKINQYQMVDIIAEGLYFFAARSGGGIDLPGSPAAGDTPIYTYCPGATLNNTSYANTGAGYGFTVLKAGTYRIFYSIAGVRGAAAYAKIQKNGTDISGSEVTAADYVVRKVIDVTLATGDIIRLQNYAHYASGWPMNLFGFGVAIAATDLQTGINGLITPISS